MRTLLLFALLASITVLAAGCCGYGGPGCGDPAIRGLCADQVSGEARVTLVFFDDTGDHASDFGTVSASPDKSLTARRGDELGEIVLVGRAPGPARLTVGDIPGWTEPATFDWDLRVVTEVDETSCENEQNIFLDPLPGAID